MRHFRLWIFGLSTPSTGLRVDQFLALRGLHHLVDDIEIAADGRGCVALLKTLVDVLGHMPRLDGSKCVRVEPLPQTANLQPPRPSSRGLPAPPASRTAQNHVRAYGPNITRCGLR